MPLLLLALPLVVMGVSAPASGAWAPPSSGNLAILVESPTADVGVPFPMNASVTGIGFSVESVRWTDSLGDTATGPSFAFVAGAPANVTVTATVDGGGGLTLRASRAVPAVATPTVNLDPPSAPLDAGSPVALTFEVAGGTPPFLWAWSVAPSPLGPGTQLSGDGPVAISATPPEPGTLVLTCELTDQWASGGRWNIPVGTVADDPTWTFSSPPLVGEVGRTLGVAAYLTGGWAPFGWWIGGSAPVWNASPSSGTLTSAGPVNWSGTFSNPGNVTLDYLARDGAGTATSANLSLRIYPSLAVGLRLASTNLTNGTIAATATIVGGVPPLDSVWSVDGTVVDRIPLSGPGLVATFLKASAGANVTVSVVVLDALGVSEAASSTAVAPARDVQLPPQDPPVSTEAPPALLGGMGWAAAGVGAAVGGLAVWALRRRGGRGGDGGHPLAEADSTVRRLLEESGGLELPTLESMAAESGLTASQVIASVDRWRRSGHLREAPGWDSGPVLHWQASPAPPAAESSTPGEGAPR